MTFFIPFFTIVFHSVGYSSDSTGDLGHEDAKSTPITDDSAVVRMIRSYIKDFVEPYMNPMNLYKREKFHTENGKKSFVKFIERENELIFNYRYLCEILGEYVRRWEEQKILARLGLPELKLTDEDALRNFYTGEAHTVEYLFNIRQNEQKQRDRWMVRHITMQYWGIPLSTPADNWRDYIEYHEQALLKDITRERDILCSPNHVAMLRFISFFLNDDGATDDAFYYCMVALNHK
jgi:hypothetical protein